MNIKNIKENKSHITRNRLQTLNLKCHMSHMYYFNRNHMCLTPFSHYKLDLPVLKEIKYEARAIWFEPGCLSLHYHQKTVITPVLKETLYIFKYQNELSPITFPVLLYIYLQFTFSGRNSEYGHLIVNIILYCWIKLVFTTIYASM